MRILRRLLSIVGWVAVLGVSLIVLATLALLFGFAAPEEKLEYSEIVGDHAVAVVPLTGEIFSSQKFREQLKRAVENPRVKAIVVRIDSPGGAVGASQEIFTAIRDVAEKKPAVCALGNIAASGGLYAAVGCKKIVTNSGTLTGSIGVIMMMPNVSEILESHGVGMTVIKSGKFKDAGSPFRPATPEDRALLEKIADGAHAQFIQAVADGRKLDPAVVRTFADGRIILGEEAVRLGLADELGDTQRAAKVALELAGDSAEPEVVWPKKPTGLLRLIGGLNELSGLSRFSEILANFTRVRVLYRAFL